MSAQRDHVDLEVAAAAPEVEPRAHLGVGRGPLENGPAGAKTCTGDIVVNYGGNYSWTDNGCGW